MATRASWKGYLEIGELTCSVSLYAAASTAERVAFHTLNRKTGHRLKRQYVDAENGKPVERDDQVKGYEISSGEHIVLEPEELAAAIPKSDKTLHVVTFIPCDEVDQIFLDAPYYLTPADAESRQVYALIREAMRDRDVVALAQTQLFRRVRTLLIRPLGQGMIANTLNFDYEVIPPDHMFADLPKKIGKGEMLTLAEHIIDTKKGTYEPSAFDDRYDDALAELVQAKIAGKKIPKHVPAPPDNVIDLMEALRESAGAGKKASASTAVRASPKTRSSHRKNVA